MSKQSNNMGIPLIIMAILAAVDCIPVSEDTKHPNILHFRYESKNGQRIDANRVAFKGSVDKPELSVMNIQVSELTYPANKEVIDSMLNGGLKQYSDTNGEQKKKVSKRNRPAARQSDDDGTKIFKVDEPGYPGLVVDVDEFGNVTVKKAEEAYVEDDPKFEKIRRDETKWEFGTTLSDHDISFYDKINQEYHGTTPVAPSNRRNDDEEYNTDGEMGHAMIDDDSDTYNEDYYDDSDEPEPEPEPEPAPE